MWLRIAKSRDVNDVEIIETIGLQLKTRAICST
jgi:hypothetical protein